MGVTLQATMNTTNGPKIETATLSSTLGGGVVIKDNLGGYFIDSILVVGISGSESSNSTSQSKISITQTEPGSSSTQSIAQSDLSHDGSSYSVNIMQFGDIVGSVLGMFSGSSGGKSVTKISSAGNSKSNTGTYWQSRAATLKSNQNVSLTGTITELGGGQLQPEGSTTGQPSNSGGASASSNGFVLWTASVSDSISGTITNGSFQPITVTIDDIVETGFIRSESTQDLRLSESVSLGSLAEPKSSSSFTIDGLTESLTVTVSAVLPPTNGGGGEPPVGGGGVGTNTGGGVGSSSWRSSHAEISTSESSLSLSESKRGLSNSRSLTDDRTENRIVSHLIWDHNQSDRTSQRVGWGSTLEFTAGHGNHGEPYVSLLKTEFVIEQVETAHYVLKESAPSYDILGDLQMTDWVNTVTHLVQTRGSGNALRFTDRTRITISTHNEGSVTYLYSGNYSTPEGNGSFIDSTIANKQVTVSESHELLTSGPYGFEPTRVVVTDRTENKTYLKSDVSEFSEGWNSVLESSFMTDRYDTKDVDSNSNSTKTKTTRKDRSPVTNSRSYAYVQEDETRSKTTVNTPDEGEAWTEKDTSEDHRTYVNRVRNNSAKGYEHEHGKAYSSHLWFSSPNGGPPSHDTSYSIRTDWPTGGVTFDDGEENGDDGSYDPTAFQKYDDEISDADLRRQVEDRLGQALSDEYWEIFLSQLRELQRRQMEQDLTIERYGSIGPSEPSFFDRAFDRLTEAEQRNYREELAKETMLTPKGEPLPEIPFAYQNRMARELHMQTLLEMPPGQISWHPDSPLHMNNLTIFLAVPYGRGSGVRPLYIRNSNGRLIPYEAYDTKVRLGIPIELSERQDLTYESKFLNKHLPNTPESLKLIASKKERAAHVFVDEATLRRAEQAIIEDGQFSGSFRYAERYGLYFEEVIGYRIDAAGNKIPLHYAEFKLNPLTGLYHLVPRTGPATPGLGE